MISPLSDCLIALGNLRTAAHAWVELQRQNTDEELAPLRDRLSAELSSSGPVRVLASSVDDTERQLARLCEIAAELTSECRKRRFDDENAARVLRSFEAALRIAEVVLRGDRAPISPSGVHRAGSVSANPKRRTAS